MKKLVVMLIMVLCFVTVFSGCGAKEEVIIYTNIEENRSQLLQERVNEQFPDLDVKIQYLSTGNTAAKIKTEGTNVEADIVLGLETSYMESLKDNFVVLNGLDGINDDHYLDGINPEHGQYYIWDQYSASITIDKKFFDDKGWAYPTSYEDLLDPKYAGLIAMPDPKSSGTGYMYYLNVMNLMGEEEGLAYFDKREDFTAAEMMLFKALELDGGKNDRIFFELAQLYMNGGKSVEDRLALHEKYAKISAVRDDCTLDHSILLTELGRYDEAKALLDAHWFHTYEGGEGNLTRHHAWLMTLVGKKLADEGDYKAAIEAYKNGYVFPLCYGEEKNYFAQESHLNYGLAMAYKAAGNKRDYEKFLKAACKDTAAPSEISYFRVMALYEAGETTAARNLAEEMIANGKTTIINKDVNNYYGVGSPCPCPFEYNFSKINTVKGLVLQAFGKLALGRVIEAKADIEEARKLDVTNFAVSMFDIFCK